MGDLPRWIDDEKVDSQAMLSAYMGYEHMSRTELAAGNQGNFRPIWWGHLTMVVHKMNGVQGTLLTQPLAGIKDMDCEKRACSRCTQGRGGYQFRWYSRAWAKRYNEMRRPGSWEAPEPLAACSDETDASLRFWRRHGLAAMPE